MKICSGFPTENGIILVVTVAGWGIVPVYIVRIYIYIFKSKNSAANVYI